MHLNEKVYNFFIHSSNGIISLPITLHIKKLNIKALLKEDIEYAEGKYFKLWRHLSENSLKYFESKQSKFIHKLIDALANPDTDS